MHVLIKKNKIPRIIVQYESIDYHSIFTRHKTPKLTNIRYIYIKAQLRIHDVLIFPCQNGFNMNYDRIIDYLRYIITKL